MEKERYLLIDGIRGLAVVNMVAYHFSYDVFVVFGRDPMWYAHTPVHIWQQFICWTFIFVAGFSWHLGKSHNLRRGLLINLCGLGITAVTLIALPSETIWFGILNFIGCAILLAIPLDTLLRRIQALPGMALSLLLFFLSRNIQSGYLGLGSLKLIRLPRSLYTRLLTPFGFPYPGFRSSDYFPLLPWFFLFLAGYFFYRLFLKHPGWRKASCRRLPLLSAIGRKSLLIYLVHQPLCMLLSMLLFS